MELSLRSAQIVSNEERNVCLLLRDADDKVSLALSRSFDMDDTWLEFSFLPRAYDTDLENCGWYPVYDCSCVLARESLSIEIGKEMRRHVSGDSELVFAHQLDDEEFTRIRAVLARLFSGKRGFQTS